MPSRKKQKSRYKTPQFHCPTCGKEYNYNTTCNGCKVRVVPISEPVTPPDFDASSLAPEDSSSSSLDDMPIREESGPRIDLSSSPAARVSKRAKFDSFMGQIYSMVADVVDSALKGKENELLREGIKFNDAEQGQANQFVYLILKNFFPGALDSLLSTGGDGGGYVALVISGAFCAMMMFRKFTLITNEMKRRKENATESPDDGLPAKYSGTIDNN